MHACVFFYRAHIINNKKKKKKESKITISAKEKPPVAI